MTFESLSDLLAGGEGARTEFKRAMPSDLGREICAFANATGGVILLGIADDGEVVGIGGHNRLKSEILSIARSADPPIKVEVESENSVLSVRIPPQSAKPYSFGGRFFMRDGASSQQLSRDEIREFFFAEGRIRFDETPCRIFSLERDIDDETWETFRRRAKVPEGMAPAVALRNLGLFGDDGAVTHAGAFLLARDIRRFHSSADLACALFMGTTKTTILDRRGFHRDVCTMVDDAVAWVRSKINVAYIIRGRVQREERPELPMDAVREALVNAVAHRDYRSSASVHLYLFKDRLEVVSPGGLPPGMTEADLGTKSVPRNRLLFRLLHRMDAVEEIGSGIRRIRELCREYGVAEPRIETSEHWVTTTFPRPDLEAEGPDPTSPKSGVQGHLGADLEPSKAPSRHQVVVLRNSLSEKPLTDFMRIVGRTDRTKFRNQVLRPLLDEGWLEMTVPDKPNHPQQKYRLTDRGRALLAAIEA